MRLSDGDGFSFGAHLHKVVDRLEHNELIVVVIDAGQKVQRRVAAREGAIQAARVRDRNKRERGH
jgi:hypothetical protein